MDIGIVSMRYAKALMEYAKSTGTEDRLYTEMRTLSRSFEKHPDLRAALENLYCRYRRNSRLSVPQQWGMLLSDRNCPVSLR